MVAESDWINEFNRNGYAIIKNFLSDTLCDQLRTRSEELIQQFDLQSHPKSVFSTTHQKNDDYFMESQDKIRFFFEENVFNEAGELNRPKNRSINKMGHGLHVKDDLFKKATFCENAKTVAKILGFEEPTVIQSMVIFKQPEIGGAVTPHQDATFLMNNPSKVIGIWIALEDADIENGCLSFIPGTQNREIRRKMIRNPKKEGPVTIFTAPPDEYDEKDFVSVPVKKGTALLIHGQVVHQSEKNNSSRSREIYTYHIAESKDTVWSKENWLQPTDVYQFPKLFDD